MTTDSPWLVGMQAQIDRAARIVQAHLDAAVLRQAFFRDAHVGHDLDPADQRRLQLLGRVGHDVQHTVDAVPQAHALLQRLEVNIAGPEAMRLEDHEIDEADDVRVVGFFGFLTLAFLTNHEVVTGILADEAVHHLGGVAVIPADGEGDLVGRSHDGIDLVAQLLAQRVDGVEIKGIGQGDPQMTAIERDGHDAQAMSEVTRHGCHHIVGKRVDAWDEVEARFRRRGAEDIQRGDAARANQLLHRAVAVLAGGATCVLHVRRLDQAMLDEEFQNIVVVCRHAFPLSQKTAKVVYAIIAAHHMQASRNLFWKKRDRSLFSKASA
jgi:hypothetical protein